MGSGKSTLGPLVAEPVWACRSSTRTRWWPSRAGSSVADDALAQSWRGGVSARWRRRSFGRCSPATPLASLPSAAGLSSTRVTRHLALDGAILVTLTARIPEALLARAGNSRRPPGARRPTTLSPRMVRRTPRAAARRLRRVPAYRGSRPRLSPPTKPSAAIVAETTPSASPRPPRIAVLPRGHRQGCSRRHSPRREIRRLTPSSLLLVTDENVAPLVAPRSPGRRSARSRAPASVT